MTSRLATLKRITTTVAPMIVTRPLTAIPDAASAVALKLGEFEGRKVGVAVFKIIGNDFSLS